MNVYTIMHTSRSSSAVLMTLVLVGCASEPDVTFTKPPERSSSSTVSSVNVSSSESSASLASLESSHPNSVQIDVPFASQAPLANWDALHEESCEEASLILVHHYITGDAITPQIMEDEIQALVAWETDHGYGYDVTMPQLAEIAEAYYGHSARVVTDVTQQSIKNELAAGRPVILPLAGQEIGNPYYSGAGPWYHVLVVTGYNGSQLITNDVGTKRGEKYAYAYDVLLDAVHDWTGVKEEIDQGAKKMLVVQ